MNMQLVTHNFACPYTILFDAAHRKANENNRFPMNLWGGLQRVPGGFRTILERVPGGFRRVPEGSMAFFATTQATLRPARPFPALGHLVYVFRYFLHMLRAVCLTQTCFDAPRRALFCRRSSLLYNIKSELWEGEAPNHCIGPSPNLKRALLEFYIGWFSFLKDRPRF